MSRRMSGRRVSPQVTPSAAAKRARSSFLTRMGLVLADVAAEGRTRESAMVYLERCYDGLKRDFGRLYAGQQTPQWTAWNRLGPDRELAALRAAAADDASWSALVKLTAGEVDKP